MIFFLKNWSQEKKHVQKVTLRQLSPKASLDQKPGSDQSKTLTKTLARFSPFSFGFEPYHFNG